MTGNWVVQPDVDVATARAVLSTDRIATAYALTDLEPPYDRYTTVATARCDGAVAACVVVRHPHFTGIVTHGDPAGLEVLLLGGGLPAIAYADVSDAHRPPFERFYTFVRPHERQLMSVTSRSFLPATVPELEVVRLRSADLDGVAQLYAEYPESAFHAEQLAYGVYCGVYQADRLVAAAGTPGLAVQSAIAVVTSVFTRPEARGRGFGSAVTSAVTAALFGLGCVDVCLDVDLTNTAAIRIYDRLGFRAHSRRWQGEAVSARNEHQP